MSRTGSIDIDFAGETFPFRLAWKQLVELQEKCDAGPFFIYERLRNGHWRVQDLRETVRLGLIGAGMEPGEALKLVRAYVEDRPLAETVLTASAILGAAILGVEDERPGEIGAANQQQGASTIFHEESSDLPRSTETVP